MRRSAWRGDRMNIMKETLENNLSNYIFYCQSANEMFFIAKF